MSRKQALVTVLAMFALGLLSHSANAQKQDAPQPASNVKTEAIVLLESQDLVTKRVASIEETWRFLQGVSQAFSEAYETNKTPETISAIVALKPGRKARLWISSSLQNQPDRADVMARFKALPVPDVHDGPIAFAIRISIAGSKIDKIPIFPKEFDDALAGKQAVLPDAITTYVWKD